MGDRTCRTDSSISRTCSLRALQASRVFDLFGSAPPTILFAMDRVVSGYVGGLPGIHAMYASPDFRWRRPIRHGDRIVGQSVLQDLVEKPSAFARRAIQQVYRTTSVASWASPWICAIPVPPRCSRGSPLPATSSWRTSRPRWRAGSVDREVRGVQVGWRDPLKDAVPAGAFPCFDLIPLAS